MINLYCGYCEKREMDVGWDGMKEGKFKQGYEGGKIGLVERGGSVFQVKEVGKVRYV